MNKELIKLSDNLGAVTNENGDVKIVEVNEEKSNLEDVLLKENEIENTQIKIDSLKRNLTDKNMRKISSIVFGAIFCLFAMPMGIALVMEEISYSFLAVFKIIPFIFTGALIPIAIIGNPFTLPKKIKNLKEKIKISEEELLHLQEELENLKKVSEFKERDESFDIISSKKEEIDPTKEFETTKTYSLNDNSLSKGKVRVLRLVPKNNVQEDNK